MKWIRKPVCWILGHDWKADPKNHRLQFSYWDCQRCGDITDNPFDVPEDRR